MSGEKNLSILLNEMQPELHSGEYVFCTVSDAEIPFDKVIATFKESEGITVVLKKEYADALGYTYTYVAAWITLEVHSSLSAVGLTAAISMALSKANISCNVMAGYYHDHIFVEQQLAKKALQVLQDVSKTA